MIPLSIAHEITKSFILSRSINILFPVPTYNYDQRHWRKIYGPEELNKIWELLTGLPADEIIPSTNNKPTVRIQKRTSSLKAESVHHKDDRADKSTETVNGKYLDPDIFL